MDGIKRALLNLHIHLTDILHGIFEGERPPYTMSPRQVFLNYALTFLGTDVSEKVKGKDTIPDAYACAETVNLVHKQAFGEEIGGGASTWLLWEALKNSTNFVRVSEPDAGDIIISPTGTQTRKALKNGHAGIFTSSEVIASNDSRSGLFLENYSLRSWRQYYGDKGGFPLFIYRRI